MNRREFVALGASTAAVPAAAQTAWDAGAVRHLLPGASPERILLKASFTRPLMQPPVLRAQALSATGRQTDGDGFYWSFNLTSLQPHTTYHLRLHDSGGKPLCDPWPLRTLPHPNENTTSLRLMVYTCAGGHEDLVRPNGVVGFLPNAHRRQLLATGLAQNPDAVIAIGDHVYWDQHNGKAALNMAETELGRRVGQFDRSLPVLGTPNEAVLKRAVERQISALYGSLFRSVPVFFLQDDHDYFENDEATESIITFPPDDFMMRLARTVQSMFYPEFLPAPGLPRVLSGVGAPDRAPGVSESYGTLRWGKLAEILLYDCRRYLTLRGPLAGFVAPEAEAWLLARMKAQETNHVVNLPSVPIGWSAGKWGDWYPDVLDDAGKLGIAKPKYFWQSGWRAQHDRLLAAASAMERIPLFLSGDLHALAEARILRNGPRNLERNPVLSVLTGPISTAGTGWPSSVRGTPPLAPVGLELQAGLEPLEHNGFTILNFTPDRVEGAFYGWKLGQPEAKLNNLQPFHRFRAERRL
ncbi:MAG: alkaline phosphatase D family protein [Bryobacterales bacterium]|nr:alkaline phosphatase D family protein [Bryobacterales bacterium]